ncbi:nucleoside monophosphate kinase [Stigmatella aurantiaca]|uniref:Adenylate kinase n=1 Tax=Stigmatella aurantiaca (strain DW4/3-1) TaxID=378806 RepID=Q091V1_STIAD|nr:aminoglycoside phosphotransferase APH(3') [Stigmatella aurantiaca]ADO71896.1 Adenylate kinase [Stigmatella aurantiaca DW4/3-1]EAU66511.1 adenylate kinase family [Stigmatella aurantiaca DW4/3-1]
MAATSLLRTSTTCPVDFEPPLPHSARSLQPVEGVPGAYLLAPVLSRGECEQLIAASEALGYAPKKSRRAGPPIRTNTRLLYEAHAGLSETLTQRMRPHLEAIDVSSVGQWRLAAGSRLLNERWRMNRYAAGEQFFPHFDTGYALGRDCRSLLSIILYLNDDFGEGETVFFPGGQTRDHMLPGDEDAREVRIRPTAGTALVFHHFGPLNPRHSGLAPIPDPRPKYVIRTDVFYTRTPPSGSATLFGRSPGAHRCVVLLGPPGAGKSTQLRQVSQALGYTGIDFGHCVRTELARSSELGARIQQFRRKRAALQDAAFGATTGAQRRPAGWLPDALSLELLERQLGPLGPTAGLVLDGFPRMRSQSNFLEGNRWEVLAAVHLKVDDATRAERLQGRTLDPATGQPFHSRHVPPGSESAVTRRPEDAPESVKARMVDWEQDTHPLLEHYAKRGVAVEVDGSGSPEAVTRAILHSLSRRLLEEATPLFPAPLAELLRDASTDGVNHSSHLDSLVFRYQPPSGAALYLKLAPPWGAPLKAEATFLSSESARQLALQVPVLRGLFTLGEDVQALLTEELSGTSAKQAAQACTHDPERARLVHNLAEALRTFHRAPPPGGMTDYAIPVLLRRARERLNRGEVPSRNFTAKYGPPLEGPEALARELDRLERAAQALAEGPRVLLHGDPCLPNFRVDSHGAFTGCLDLSGVGSGDRYWDLALAHWSVQHNLGERWAEAFLGACCGEHLDPDRLSFFAGLRRFLV